MKLTKKVAAVFLSASVLAACNQGEKVAVNKNEEVQKPIKEEIQKHEAATLPVTIFSDSSYKIEGETVAFDRSIQSIEMKDFDEPSELEFYDRYGKTVRNQGFNLQQDYKLLKILLKQETKEEARSKPLEAFMLNEGSGLVIGDTELASQNEFLLYQQEFLSTDFKVGKTLEGKGEILMAIPREFADDPNLQFRVIQNIDSMKKNIYIDLN